MGRSPVGAVNAHVGHTLDPGVGLMVQVPEVGEGSTLEEGAVHVAHASLDLALSRSRRARAVSAGGAKSEIGGDQRGIAKKWPTKEIRSAGKRGPGGRMLKRKARQKDYTKRPRKRGPQLESGLFDKLASCILSHNPRGSAPPKCQLVLSPEEAL